MTKETNIDDFTIELECIYKNERYSVRDNGAIMRHSKREGRVRPNDNIWTFGTPNPKGYCQIAGEVIHRIVAIAFIGEPPTSQHVVDHIDTNRQNNRPENLRWLTKLENALNNPITRKRIVYNCGSIEAFIENPSLLRNTDGGYSDIEWMRTVTPEEAKNSWKRLSDWAKKENTTSTGGRLGDWVFSELKNENIEHGRQNYITSLTPRAVQRIVFLNDKPNEFPCTPQEFVGDPLVAYADNLTKEAIFFRNHNGPYVVVKSGFSKDRQSLYILTKAGYVYQKREDGEHIPILISELSDAENDGNSVPHALTSVTYENGLFIHDRPETGFLPKEYIEKLFAEYTQD